MAHGSFDHDQFARVLAYYRECLRYDADRSVLLRKADEGVTFVPLKLKSEWTLSRKGKLNAPLPGKFASELSQPQFSADLMYAYPLLATFDQNRELELLPVFLQPVDHEVNGGRLSASLRPDSPEVNDAFCNAIGVRNPEEKAQLYGYLKLTEDEEQPPGGLSDFVRRLAEWPGLPGGERLNPECIPQEPEIRRAGSKGMLNRHLLVITERPNFTRGLEQEMKALSGNDLRGRLSETALKYFFGVAPSSESADDPSAASDCDITEVVPLNEEQRSAVQSAFSNDLTVVTGPPGTGKSQIVTTVIANAWIRGESVLFASYNNKAVDVVEERVKGLSSRPLMIRTGRRAGDRNLRNEIVNFLSSVLAFRVSDEDRQGFSDSKRDVNRLKNDRASIDAKLEKVRINRNRAYRLYEKVCNLASEREELDEQYRKINQRRQQAESRLKAEMERIEEQVKEIKRERHAAQADRDQQIGDISAEIENLRQAADFLRQTDRRFGKDDEIDIAFFADMDRMYVEQDSLRQKCAIETSKRDAKVEYLKNQQIELKQDFDKQKWDRQRTQDLVCLRGMVLKAQGIVAHQADRSAPIWSKMLKRLRRSATLEKVGRLSEAWSNEYDILGRPPSVPIAATDLEHWLKYFSDALNRLSVWEKAAERNRESAVGLERVEAEIEKVEADFAAHDFDLLAAQLEERILVRKQAEIDSLFEQIDHNRKQVPEVNEVFANMRFKERIDEKHGEIADLKREHKYRFDAMFADLDAKRADNRRNFDNLSLEFEAAAAELSELGKVNDLATELRRVEKQLWDAGERLIKASVRVLPDRFDIGTKQEIRNFKALFERLRDDELGGSTFRRLMNQMDELFPKILKLIPAWCVTNLSVRDNIPFNAGMFDLVIIDEASQCNTPSALPLFYRAKRAMVIGDPHQLRHITKIGKLQDQKLQEKHSLDSASDMSFGYEQQSLYDIAVGNVGNESLRSLHEHFRSHRDIIEFSNQYWYGKRLLVCTDYNDLQIPTGEQPGIRWCDVNGRVERSSHYNGNINEIEAQALSESVVDLIANRGFRGSVGVVTPFRAQANLIRELLNERLGPSDAERCELITDTAHAFQGDEKDVVFFSPCVEFEMPDGADWFLYNTRNLFNVAITRPRALLVVVGNLEACLASKISHVKGFAEFYDKTLKGKETPNASSSFDDDQNIGHWERPFYNALIAAELKPMHQYLEGQYRLDFAFVTDNIKLNVEVDGKTYHREWDGSRSRNDLMRDHRLMGMGWQIKRFEVYELRDDMERCVAEVKELLL